MKKILLGAALFFATGVSAQIYFEDDFSSGLNNWVLVDSDGDGEEWFQFTDNGNEVASSASWNSTVGALTPDNWMVSGAIDLSSASGTTMLSWTAKGQDQAYPAENYSVYVGTSDDINDMIAAGEDFNEVLTATNNQYVSRSLDISSQNGQQAVYVAFRHHDITDQFRLNIDDVKIEEPANNDLALLGIDVDMSATGDRTFMLRIRNQGTTNITSYDLEYTFDGGSTNTENVTGINLDYGDFHHLTININGVSAGSKDFAAEITTSDDDSSNNSATATFNFMPAVPQYVSTDTEGNQFDLHQRLQDGQAIILDFMASWCGPCQSSTPALSELVENNGAGNGKVEALAISIESTDDDATLNGLNWNGGFYEYPKFPYSSDNMDQYTHYAVNHGFNSQGAIPFFVMICPNKQDPESSSIIKHDVGYGQGMFGAYQIALDECESATADIVNMDNEMMNFKVYPNPSSNIINVDFELNTQEEVAIKVINTMGQTVSESNLGSVSGVQSTQLDVSSLESGMYIVKVQTTNGEQTKRISVIK